MKMPQNTPKAVSRLRVLLRVMVTRISSQVSLSIFIWFSFFELQATSYELRVMGCKSLIFSYIHMYIKLIYNI